MKLRALRLANAIKAGHRQADFLEEKNYDMEFVDAVRISVTPKSKPKSGTGRIETSIFNAIWWDPIEEPAAKKGGK